MNLDAKKFSLACAGAFAILWLVCSLLVVISPMGMMNMSGNMIHGDLTGMRWSMGFFGFIIGLIVWSFLAGITGWLIATLYNKQSE